MGRPLTRRIAEGLLRQRTAACFVQGAEGVDAYGAVLWPQRIIVTNVAVTGVYTHVVLYECTCLRAVVRAHECTYLVMSVRVSEFLAVSSCLCEHAAVAWPHSET